MENYTVMNGLLLGALIILGCSHFQNKELVSRNGVKSIHVIRNFSPQGNNIESIITNTDSIAKIISHINESTAEPVKFLAKIKLQIVYSDTTLNVMCSWKNIRINGKTYKSGKDIQLVLGK